MAEINDVAQRLKEKTGVEIKSAELLTLAFSHPSACGPSQSYQRLEFLGDSFIGYVVAQYLFDKYRKSQEGELTGMRSFIVSAAQMAKTANELELETMLITGKTLKSPTAHVMANIFESLTAAILLDCGFDVAKSFVIRHLVETVTPTIENGLWKDTKTILQNYCQKKGKSLPEYRLVEETGPAHKKLFKVSVSFGGKNLGTGTGRTKQEAEKSAAEAALKTLGLQPAKGNGQDGKGT